MFAAVFAASEIFGKYHRHQLATADVAAAAVKRESPQTPDNMFRKRKMFFIKKFHLFAFLKYEATTSFNKMTKHRNNQYLTGNKL